MGRLDCKKDREATMKPIPCLIAAASLCVGLGDAHAQSAFFLRLAPEVGRITVEHTKKVTLQGGSSSSTSSSSSLALAGTLSGRSAPEAAGELAPGRRGGGRRLRPPQDRGHDFPDPDRKHSRHLARPVELQRPGRGRGGNILFGRRLGAGPFTGLPLRREASHVD